MIVMFIIPVCKFGTSSFICLLSKVLNVFSFRFCKKTVKLILNAVCIYFFLRYNSHTLLKCRIWGGGLIYLKVVQPSPLSNSKIFSLHQKENHAHQQA